MKRISVKAGLCFAALLLAGALAAEEIPSIDWDNDPMTGFHAAWQRPASAPLWTQAARLQAPEDNNPTQAGDEMELRLLATPLGSKALSPSSPNLRFNRPTISFVLNNDKDRVGAKFSVCESAVNYEDAVCEEIRYVFPQLRYDASTKQILLDNRVVARDHWFGGIRMSEDFSLSYAVSAKVEDDGFNRRSVKIIDVYLSKKAEIADPR